MTTVAGVCPTYILVVREQFVDRGPHCWKVDADEIAGLHVRSPMSQNFVTRRYNEKYLDLRRTSVNKPQVLRFHLVQSMELRYLIRSSVYHTMLRAVPTSGLLRTSRATTRGLLKDSSSPAFLLPFLVGDWKLASEGKVMLCKACSPRARSPRAHSRARHRRRAKKSMPTQLERHQECPHCVGWVQTVVNIHLDCGLAPTTTTVAPALCSSWRKQ